MLRQIIYFAIIIFGLLFFYQKFVASTVEPFFKGKTGNVDFYQLKITDVENAKSMLKAEGI